MRAPALMQRLIESQFTARRRLKGPPQLLDFAIGACALGSVAMIAAAWALDAVGLGLELGSRLVFALLLLVAVRPWVRR